MEVSYRQLRLHFQLHIHTNSSPSSIYKLPQFNRFKKKKYDSIADNATFPQHKFSPTVPMSIQQFYFYPTVVGTSHGLFCVYGYSSGINMAVVWNPSIRKSVSFVVPNVLHGPYENVLGFGVYGNACDVKIVKVTYVHMWTGMESLSSVPGQVDVFELSSGVWKSSCGNLPGKSIRFTWSQVVLDGFIYWFAFNRISNIDNDGFQTCNVIMSFDMKSEEFKEIYLPERLAPNVDVEYLISKLKESLVVLEYNIHSENPVYSVWMMEDGVSKSFTKLFTINSPGVSIKKILGFRKNGDIVVETTTKDYEAALQVYEPSSVHINDLGIHGDIGSFRVSSYMETLLLLDP